MTATITKPPSLDEKIAAALAGPESDPHTIALLLESGLTRVERRALLLAGLADRVQARIRAARSADVGTSSCYSHRDEHARLAAWRDVSDEEFLAQADAQGNYMQLARHYGVSYQTIVKRSRRLGTRHARAMQEIDERCMASLSEALTDMAQQFEGAVLRRAEIQAQRVCVDGEWKRLSDCTAADVKWLRDDRLKLAGEVVRAGGYFEAIYDRMVAAGAATVNDICVD